MINFSTCESNNQAFAHFAFAKLLSMENVRVRNLRALIRDGFGGSQKSLSDKTKVSLSQLGQYLGGSRNMGEKTARKIELASGKPLGWLDRSADTASDDLQPILAWNYEDDLPDGEYVFVKRFDVSLSCGAGKAAPEVVETKEKPAAFRADWIRELDIKPKNLACMRATGDSMEPRIFDNDSLLVELGNNRIIDGKIYAIYYSDGLVAKRVFRRVDGGITIHSENPKYPPIEVTPDQMEHIKIIGRVRQIQSTGDL